MASRGESSFNRLPRLGARLYDVLTRSRAMDIHYTEIAQDLLSRVQTGRLLDIGTGPGRLLLELKRLGPHLELFGLDTSDAMVQLAARNLAPIRVNLRQGNVRATSYESGFFDAITCTGSFYLWDCPEEGLEEIHRILKEDCTAYLYETHKDYRTEELEQALRFNGQGDNLLRRALAPLFLKRQLYMTYSTDEVSTIVGRTSFAGSFTIERITLAGLPVWHRIALTRC